MDVQSLSAAVFAPITSDARIRIGKHLRAHGVPAILIGVAAVVAAAGAGRAFAGAAPRLPETVGELRALVRTLREERPTLR